MMRGRIGLSELNETGAFMKLSRKRQFSRAFLIAGVVLILLGLVTILCYYGIDYTVNVFDVIFFIPMIVKSLFYGSLLVIGWIQIGVGSVCFLLGIPAIPDVAQSFRNYNGYFEKGSVPTEQELHDMLESGEITKHEYDEIHSYMDDKKR